MTTNTQPQTQQSGGDELEQILIRLLSMYNIETVASEDFDVALAALQARERAARADELGQLLIRWKAVKLDTKYDIGMTAGYVHERLQQLQLKPQASEGVGKQLLNNELEPRWDGKKDEKE